MTDEAQTTQGEQAPQAEEGKPVFIAERNRGKFVSLPPSLEKHKITKETSAEMARRRHEKYRQAAAAEVAKKVGGRISQVSTPVQAWSYIVADQVGKILDSDKPRGDDVRQVGQWIGAVVSESDRTLPGENLDGGSGGGIAAHAMALLAELAQTQRAQADTNAAQAQVNAAQAKLHAAFPPMLDGVVMETDIYGSNNEAQDTGTAAADHSAGGADGGG